MKIVIGSDESGTALKQVLKDALGTRGIEAEDLGSEFADSAELPRKVAATVSEGRADQGIIIWSSGQSMLVDANTFPGVRAVLCFTPHMARIARSHNDGNVLVIGADLVGEEDGLSVLNEWLDTTPRPSRERGADRTVGISGISDRLRETDPDMHSIVFDERRRQRRQINLIASENYTSQAVLIAQGSVLSNKYAEGYPGKRWYNGCEVIDRAEALAIERAKQLFGADHANVQPHSGSGANMTVYSAVLEPGDPMLAMRLDHGGHLTHGHTMNFSGRLYNVAHYGVDRESERLDYDAVAELAREHKPKLIVVGASAYSRAFDYERFRAIADEVGAYLMADIAHVAGLIVGECHPNPVPHCEFVTSTTHKTLRGPRGGIILCRKEFAKIIDREIFPGTQGGPSMHTIAAKAVAFHEALQPGFKDYAKQIVQNAESMATTLSGGGLRVVSGGTDNHMMQVDVRPLETTGRDASNALEAAGIAVNKNAIPFDPNPPAVASGIRIGTPAITTRGMKEGEAQLIASKIVAVLKNASDTEKLASIKDELTEFALRFPLP